MIIELESKAMGYYRAGERLDSTLNTREMWEFIEKEWGAWGKGVRKWKIAKRKYQG